MVDCLLGFPESFAFGYVLFQSFTCVFSAGTESKHNSLVIDSKLERILSMSDGRLKIHKGLDKLM